MNAQEVVETIRGMGDPKNVEGMRRYGIGGADVAGVSVTELRKLAKTLGRDHGLALELWASGLHEARILASMVDDPTMVTRPQMEDWVGGFDSWDVCDQCCQNLFDKVEGALDVSREWIGHEDEFVKRAGFVLMATTAVHDKSMTDANFWELFPLIEQGAADDRNYVKKGVSWALRQIGKRNSALHAAALEVGRSMATSPDKSTRWVGKDAIRDLERRLPG